jgi:hypothetical protein
VLAGRGSGVCYDTVKCGIVGDVSRFMKPDTTKTSLVFEYGKFAAVSCRSLTKIQDL